jgi:hypothetical protein
MRKEIYSDNSSESRFELMSEYGPGNRLQAWEWLELVQDSAQRRGLVSISKLPVLLLQN